MGRVAFPVVIGEAIRAEAGAVGRRPSVPQRHERHGRRRRRLGIGIGADDADQDGGHGGQRGHGEAPAAHCSTGKGLRSNWRNAGPSRPLL